MLKKLLYKHYIGKFGFYALSFTWGLLQTLIGAIYAFVFLITGHKPKRFGYCVCFESTLISGGFNIGIFIFSCKSPTKRLLMHEHGHAIQNCYYGAIMPFIVSAPSFLRYHYRNFSAKVLKKPQKKPYDSIWFEKEATEIGCMMPNI